MCWPFPFSIHLVDAVLFKALWLSVLTQFQSILLQQVNVSWGFVYSGGFDCKSPVLWINQRLKWSETLIYLGRTVFQLRKSEFGVHLPLHLFEPPALMLTNGNQMKCAKCFCQRVPSPHMPGCDLSLQYIMQLIFLYLFYLALSQIISIGHWLWTLNSSKLMK